MRQGQRLGHGLDRAGRPAGGAIEGTRRARPLRRAVGRRDGAAAAPAVDGSGGAQPFRRSDPARADPGAPRRSYPCQRHRRADQPAGRRGAGRRGLPRQCRRSLCDARLRPGQGLRQGARRGARQEQHDPDAARDLHLVGRPARELRSNDRTRRSRRASAGQGEAAPVCTRAPAQEPRLAGRDHAAPARPSGAAERSRRPPEADDSGLPHQSRDPRFLQRQNAADLAASGNATPDHVLHIKRKAVALPAPEAGKLRRFRRQARLGARRLCGRLPRLFRTQQRPRRRRPDHARPSAAGVLRRRPRDLRRWRLGKGGEDLRRHRRGDRRGEGQGGRLTWLGSAAGSGDVRRRILVAGTGEAGQAGREAALRADRCRDRRRERSWVRGRQGAPRRRRGSRRARYRSRRGRQDGEVDRRARHWLRRH